MKNIFSESTDAIIRYLQDYAAENNSPVSYSASEDRHKKFTQEEVFLASQELAANDGFVFNLKIKQVEIRLDTQERYFLINDYSGNTTIIYAPPSSRWLPTYTKTGSGKTMISLLGDGAHTITTTDLIDHGFVDTKIAAQLSHLIRSGASVCFVGTHSDAFLRAFATFVDSNRRIIAAGNFLTQIFSEESDATYILGRATKETLVSAQRMQAETLLLERPPLHEFPHQVAPQVLSNFSTEDLESGLLEHKFRYAHFDFVVVLNDQGILKDMYQISLSRHVPNWLTDPSDVPVRVLWELRDETYVSLQEITREARRRFKIDSSSTSLLMTSGAVMKPFSTEDQNENLLSINVNKEDIQSILSALDTLRNFVKRFE